MVVPCSEVAMSDDEKESEARCKAMLNKLISMVKEQTVEMEALAVRLKATVQPLRATVHGSSPSVAALTATCAATEDHAVATATPRAEAALTPKLPTRCSTNCSDDDTASQTFTLLPDAASGPPPTTTLLDIAIPDPNVVDAKVLDSGLDSEAWLKASARPMRVRQKHALSQSVGKPMQEIDMANVYVGRVPSTVTADQLVELFRPFGQIVQARMFKFHGYGMVRYDSPSSAAAAIDYMDGYHVGGSTLGVRVARLPAESDAATNAPTLQMTGNEQGQIDMTNLYVCCSDFSCVVLLNYVRWQHFPGPSLTNVDHLSINEESSLMTQHISHEPAIDREACPELLADATTTDGSILDKSISCLPGTTSRQYRQLEDGSFHTVRKLLQHFPRTYADLQNPQGLIEDGQYIMLFGTVVFSRGIRIKYTLSFLEVVVGCSIIETESSSSVKSFNSEAEQKKMIHFYLKKFFSGTHFSSQSFLNCISSKYREGDPVYVSGKGDVGCGKTAVAFLACMEDLKAFQQWGTRSNLLWLHEPLHVPDEVKRHWGHHIDEGASLEAECNAKFAEYAKKYHQEAAAVTRVVDSMTDNLRPTCAVGWEATDVANAVLDGSDAILLGAVTLRGLYPVETSSTVGKICAEAEKVFNQDLYFKRAVKYVGKPMTHLESIASSAVRAAIKVKASVIICFTSSGRAIRLILKYRPTMPVLSVVIPRLKTNQLRWSFTGAFEASRSLIDSQQLEFEQLKHEKDNALKDAEELRREHRDRTWVDFTQEWIPFWSQPRTQCEVYALRGAYGSYNLNSLSCVCNCIKGFSQKVQRDWDLGDYRGGCKRNVPLQCQMDLTMVKTEADRFYTIEGVRLPDNAQNAEARNSQDCQVVCLNNCSCNAYAYNINGCFVWHVDLVNLQEQYYRNGSTLFLRLAASEIPVSEKTRKRKVVIICALVIGGIVVLTIFASVLYMLIQRCCRERALWISNRDTLISFQYSDLKHGTKNFVEKLGGGAFGSVFKGRLTDSTFIAVKRLERLHHGEKQFCAEVSTIGMINHVNLVRLLGFCAEETRRLLVYEYMQVQQKHGGDGGDHGIPVAMVVTILLYRLGGKPKFKEGGMSHTSLPLLGLPWAVGRVTESCYKRGDRAIEERSKIRTAGSLSPTSCCCLPRPRFLYFPISMLLLLPVSSL